MEKFIICLYFWPYYLCYKLHFGIKMCTIKFSIELNTVQIIDKDPTISNICEKCTNFQNGWCISESSAPLPKSFGWFTTVSSTWQSVKYDVMTSPPLLSSWRYIGEENGEEEEAEWTPLLEGQSHSSDKGTFPERSALTGRMISSVKGCYVFVSVSSPKICLSSSYYPTIFGSKSFHTSQKSFIWWMILRKKKKYNMLPICFKGS